MGRITVSFHERFLAEVESLKSFRDALRTKEDQAAYDTIIKAASFERGAMVNSDIVIVLDAILLCGLVYMTAGIARLEKRVQELEKLLNEKSQTEVMIPSKDTMTKQPSPT